MNWDDLRVFLAVCQNGSLSAAGEYLGMNHTTVGRRMTALEEELKTRLFDRSRDGYSMTQAAEEMYARALSMDEQAQAISRENLGRDRELKGSLVLTAPYDFANAIVLPHLGKFVRRYPLIELEVTTSLELANLDARDADLALRITKMPPPHLVGRKLFPLSLGIYGSRKYLESTGPQELILFRDKSKIPAWTESFPHARISCRIDSTLSQYQAVRAGMGIARLPCFIGDADKSLVRLPTQVSNGWWIWLLHHADLRATERVRAGRDFLYDVINSQKALILGENSRYQ